MTTVTLLNKDMIKKINKYVALCEKQLKDFKKHSEFHKSRPDGAGSDKGTYERLYDAEIPSKERLSLYIGVSTSVLDNWRDRTAKSITDENHEAYLGALNKINTIQYIMLTEGTTLGIFKEKVPALILMNNHNLKERTDTTTNDKELPAPIIPLERK